MVIGRGGGFGQGFWWLVEKNKRNVMVICRGSGFGQRLLVVG